MTVLPLTVLVHNSPMARAYLGALFSAGYKVQKLILLAYKSNPVNGRNMGAFIPFSSIKKNYILSAQDHMFNYWSRFIHDKYPDFYTGLTTQISSQLDIPIDFFAHI